jgi:hypothetical protein
MIGIFNKLIMFDQHLKQNSVQSIVPDLANDWSWNEDGTELTLPLRHGVKWHCQLSGHRAPVSGPARLERGSTIGGQGVPPPERPCPRHGEHTTAA